MTLSFQSNVTTDLAGKLVACVAISAIFAKEAITFRHDKPLKIYEYLGGSGKKMFNFVCPRYFGIVACELEIFPGLLAVPIGILNDAKNFELS